MAETAHAPLTTNPKHVVASYLVLAFGLSSVFWYIILARPQFAADTGLLRWAGFLLMWCPAAAAVVTRLAYQGNLLGFGFKLGELRWWLLAIAIPIAVGAVMFSTAWVSGAAPFLPDKAAAMLTLPALQAILIGICTNIVSATGEELGWRGLLVPELARFTGFTQIAIVSAFIWGCWHLPLMVFGSYHGPGALWYSVFTFFLSIFGGSTIFAWIRLRSGSIWPAALLHGFWNYFIQKFYPAITATTGAGGAMVGEFGWLTVLISIVLGLLFWHLRKQLPKMPSPGGGL
jgi:membrane protease YdiL (CAAX protease family)